MSAILPVVSLILSCVAVGWSISWSVYQHRHAKAEKERERHERENEKKERVEATAHVLFHKDRLAALEVQIYNPCAFAINIEAVELQCLRPQQFDKNFLPEYQLTIPFVTTIVPLMRDRGDGVMEAVGCPWASPGCRMEPLTGAQFLLENNHPKFREVLDVPPEKIWVSISSAGGEIGRIEGAQVVEYLKALGE